MSVVRVERLEDGTRRVHLTTVDEGARACPVCGVISVKPKGTAVTRPRDLPYGERGLEFRWHKRPQDCRALFGLLRAHEIHAVALALSARDGERVGVS
ncbi:hypothetical protein [Streptomyces sp. NPDC001340]